MVSDSCTNAWPRCLSSVWQLGKFLGAVGNVTIVASNLINARNDSYLGNYTIDTYAIYTFAGGERVRTALPCRRYLCPRRRISNITPS
jgi:hypothetical protein